MADNTFYMIHQLNYQLKWHGDLKKDVLLVENENGNKKKYTKFNQTKGFTQSELFLILISV